MSTITELRKRLRAINKKQAELQKQEYALEDEISKIENERYEAKVKKELHEGDIRVINEGITHYHCDPMFVYEILSIHEYTNRYKHNKLDGTSEIITHKGYSIKVREFNIHAYDSDMISHIEIKTNIAAETLLKAKKMSKEEFEEFKSTLFLNPDSYKGSKWEVPTRWSTGD